MKYQKHIAIIFLLATVSLPLVGLAQTPSCGPTGSGYKLCVPLGGQVGETVNNFGDYVKMIYQFALAIAGIVAFIAIVYGGIQYTLSAGNIVSQQEATATITQAIYGLVLLLVAALILYTINPDLLRIGRRVKEGTLFNQQNLNVSPLKSPDGFFQSLFGQAQQRDAAETARLHQEAQLQAFAAEMINHDYYQKQVVILDAKIAEQQALKTPTESIEALQTERRRFQQMWDDAQKRIDANPTIKKQAQPFYDQMKNQPKQQPSWWEYTVFPEYGRNIKKMYFGW